MALIKCPECRKEVSDTALACPHCGFAVKQYVEDCQAQQLAEQKALEKQQREEQRAVETQRRAERRRDKENTRKPTLKKRAGIKSISILWSVVFAACFFVFGTALFGAYRGNQAAFVSALYDFGSAYIPIFLYSLGPNVMYIIANMTRSKKVSNALIIIYFVWSLCNIVIPVLVAARLMKAVGGFSQAMLIAVFAMALPSIVNIMVFVLVSRGMCQEKAASNKRDRKWPFAISCVALILISLFAVAEQIKYLGNTPESRAAIMRKDYNAEYVVSDKALGDLYFTVARCSDGRITMARFAPEFPGAHRVRSALCGNRDDIIVEELVHVGDEAYSCIYLDRDDLDYVMITYSHSFDDYNSGKTVRYAMTEGNTIVCVEAQYFHPDTVVFYDKHGKTYEWHTRWHELG